MPWWWTAHMVLTATRRRIFLGITVFIYSSWTAGELGIGGTSWGHGSRGLLQLRIVSLAWSSASSRSIGFVNDRSELYIQLYLNHLSFTIYLYVPSARQALGRGHRYLVVRNAFSQVSSRGRVTRILQRIRDADLVPANPFRKVSAKFHHDGHYLPYSDEKRRYGMLSVSLVSVQVNIKVSWSLAPIFLSFPQNLLYVCRSS